MKNRCVYEPFAKKISKSYKVCGLLKAFQYKLCLFLSFALLLILFAITTSPCLANEDMLIWTEQELSFMKNHPIIRLGVDPNFVPFEFIDEHGSYKGIAADYLALVSKKTGLEFEIIDLPWPEAYDMAIAGEVDALPAIGKTSERQEHFLFSEPYYYYKRVIVTRDIDTNINSIDDLEGYTVAVQRNSSHHSYLLDYPKINLSLYDSVEAALTDVATGTEKAFIGNLATTNYLIRSTGLNNLRFISFEAEKQQALHFAVRKDFPELISIFNKALSSVTDSERLAINNKWIELDTSPDYGPIYRLLSIAGAIITIIFLVSVFWITRLRKEIKQRKLIQVDLEQSKLEADVANEYKSRFMARMSHEIRTPLNAIMGISYLLKNTDLTLTQSMYTDRITQASNSMLSIINDILDYSKIEAGKVELEMTSFNMDQVIQGVVNIVSYKIEEQNIGFRLSKDPHLPSWFIGDSKRIEQILLNILNNAAKFTHSGQVSLYLRLIAIENDICHMSFSIQDTGIGMSKDQVDKLFKPFEQADSSINRRFGGSGLGLSIVKSLLDMMGGKIEVFSTLGQGSTFIVTLPLTIDKDKEAIHKESLSLIQFKNVKTLVLEKSGANINLIENYLNSFGIHCELTSSEVSALNMLEAANGKFAKPFDLFIIDYSTPSEGGFNYVKELRNNQKIIKQPKIIMLLPMKREDLFDRLSDYCIDFGVGKPIIPSILLDSILDIFNLKAVSTSYSKEENDLEAKIMIKTYQILLAEDNKTNQLIVKSLLDKIGVKTIIANNGREAVDMFIKYKENIDLILMDLHMPVMNGFEAIENIRNMSSQIPIVVMTADITLSAQRKFEQFNISHSISKPFNPDHLIATIKDILLKAELTGKVENNVLDRQLGLKNLAGDSELYKKVLEKYLEENLNTLDRLKEKLDDKKYLDAAQIIHKVKSSSGSIGAKPVQELASSFQKALDEENEVQIGPLYGEFTCLFRELLEEIKNLLINQ